MIKGEIIFSNLRLGQQYLLIDINKIFRQKWLVKMSKFVWRKKNKNNLQLISSHLSVPPFSTLKNLTPYNFTPYFLLPYQYSIATF